MNLQTNIADDINRHHQIAMEKADEAVAHARVAGKLLLEVKASLPHGHFGAWLKASVNVSSRQAQRYMAVAEGKPVPLRSIGSKYDTVSYLSDEEKQAKALAEYFKPTWEPTPGYQMEVALNDATFWVNPSLEHPGYFYISKLSNGGNSSATDLTHENGGGYLDFTKKPIHSVGVEMFLGSVGLKEPAKQKWISTLHTGVSRAMGDE